MYEYLYANVDNIHWPNETHLTSGLGVIGFWQNMCLMDLFNTLVVEDMTIHKYVGYN